ncbi:MAG: hypothetical protein K5867_09805 [Bacteroidales bacterium]|nr:hypothetical protein [Bacteroidales bacterium]
MRGEQGGPTESLSWANGEPIQRGGNGGFGSNGKRCGRQQRWVTHNKKSNVAYIE